MKNKYMKYGAFFIVGISFSLSLFLLLLPRNSFSENENRLLARFPKINITTIFNGTAMTGLESYVTDHFPFRDYFVGVKSQVDLAINRTKIGNVYIGNNEHLIEDYDYLDDLQIERVIRTVDKLVANDFKVNLALIPTDISIYSERLPRFVDNKNQKEDIDKIYKQLVNINAINIYDKLLQHKDEELFFRLDHHWNMLGAYYGYQAFMESVDKEYLSLDSFKKETVTTDFNGSLFSRTGIYTFASDTMDVYKKEANLIVDYVYDDLITDTMFAKEFLETKNKYGYFLNGEQMLFTITNNDIDDNSQIIVLKDSFADIFIPFLTNHYNKIHVVDPRYYNFSVIDYMNQEGIKEVLVLYSINQLGQDIGFTRIN